MQMSLSLRDRVAVKRATERHNGVSQSENIWTKVIGLQKMSTKLPKPSVPVVSVLIIYPTKRKKTKPRHTSP